MACMVHPMSRSQPPMIEEILTATTQTGVTTPDYLDYLVRVPCLGQG